MTSHSEARSGEQGFTLVEALVAMVVLVFGLIAITNLLIVASGSNTVASHSTTAAAQAAEVMERLKAAPFVNLQPGGALTKAAMDGANCDPSSDANGCLGVANFNLRRSIDGIGWIHVVWQITDPGAGGPGTRFIVVRAESRAPLAGERSRAEFTTFRTCTASSPPC